MWSCREVAITNVPLWLWDDVNMDFVVDLPHTTRAKDAIWVIVGRLSKACTFYPYSINKFNKRLRSYIKEIFRLHAVPHTIVSDRDAKFVSMFSEGV